MTLLEEIRNGKNAALEFKEAYTSLDAEIGVTSQSKCD